MKTKIAFVCWWGRSSTWLLNYYANYSQDGTPNWNNLVGTDRIEEADVVFILESLPPGMTNDYKKVLLTKKLYLIRHEPPDISTVSNIPVGPAHLPPEFQEKVTYVDYTMHDVLYPSKWDMGEVFSYKQFKELEYQPKDKKISCIVSGKLMIPGHVSRLNFVDNFIQDSKYPLDLYGRNTLSGANHLGELSVEKKHTAYQDYEYSLSFENCQIKNYVTCKVFEPLLMWSMPIYWGSSDIEKYLPEGSYYQIADFGHDRVAEIDEFIKNKPTEKNIKAMREARNLILDQYNIWASVEKIMENF